MPASCITNEWCQESDAVTGMHAQNVSGTSTPNHSTAEGKAGEPELDELSAWRSPDRAIEMVEGEHLRKPRPSVSWASWLLSFLLNHTPLRRLVMRSSLFRTLVAYLRSSGAPHRLRVVPLLTHLVRSHAEFEDGPPPLEELSGLLAAVLRECDKLTGGRGPGSAAWRPGDCPGGLQLETKWANAGLLLLTDLVTATRRAQDSLRQGPVLRLAKSKVEGQGRVEAKSGDELRIPGESGDEQESGEQESASCGAGEGAVKVCVPPFGTRLDEGPVEEGGEEEAEEADRSLADQVLIGGRSLGAEDRALLEVDLRNAALPDTTSFAPRDEVASSPDNLRGAEAGAASPSRCLHHLLEIMDSLGALRDGWPSSPPTTAPQLPSKRQLTPHGALYLDSLLCEAWMDAVGPAAVLESEHPFKKGAYTETLHFPGAEEMVVFLDPRSCMKEVRPNVRPCARFAQGTHLGGVGGNTVGRVTVV